MLNTGETIEAILASDDKQVRRDKLGSFEHSLSTFVFFATALPTVILSTFFRYKQRDFYKAVVVCFVYLFVVFSVIQWRFHDVVSLQQTLKSWYENISSNVSARWSSMQKYGYSNTQVYN